MQAASWLLLLLASLAVAPPVAIAEQAPSVTADTIRDATPPNSFETNALPVPRDEDAQGSKDLEQWFWIWDQYGVRNVTHPNLTVVPPRPGKATGVAVIVAPGGGFDFVSWSNEGQPVAQWLAERGITAFILKYRTKPTPRDNAGYAAFVRDQIARSQSPDRRFSPLPPEAEADAKQAIRYVRQHAGRFGVDAQRVGFLGFSAGAIAGVSVATSADPADRPNFLGAIYGPLFPRVVPKSPPPLFAARALDDPLYHPLEKSLDDSFGLLAAWRANGGSVELHLYSSGGHGFGMQKNGATSELWIEQFFEWMKAQGLMWRIGTPGQ